MEGYGIFSPNLLKAHYYAEHNDVEKSKEEIYNHFYRRGNQGVYDCLLSDMQYCEDNMYSSVLPRCGCGTHHELDTLRQG